MTISSSVNLSNKNLKNKEEIISSIAMLVTLISFGMLFATLLLGFAIFRFTSAVWPPNGMVRPSLILPTISTLFIFMSSYFYYNFEFQSEKIYKKINLLIAIILGLFFLIAQTLFWESLKKQGLFVSSGLYPSILYAFTWIHAFHILLGLILLIGLYLKNDFVKTTALKIKVNNIGKFWHFLGVIWLIMFVTIFVL